MQVLPSRTFVVVATEITEGTQCHGTKSYHLSHTIVDMVQGFLTVVCILGIVKFEIKFQAEINTGGRDILAKIGLFKLTVVVQILQRIVLNALCQSSVLKTTTYLTYNDLNLSLNSLLTCFEAFIFSILFVWPYWP